MSKVLTVPEGEKITADGNYGSKTKKAITRAPEGLL